MRLFIGVYSLQILPSSKINIESIVQYAHKGLWIAAGSSFLLAVFFFFYPFDFHQEIHDRIKDTKGAISSYRLEEIGKGPLSLYPMRRSSSVPDLSREIIVLAKSSRPDTAPGQEVLLLTTKGNSHQKTVSSGEQIFLECIKNKDDEDSYVFSNKKTSLWIRPLLTGGDDVNLEVGVFSADLKTESFFEEISQVFVQQVKMALARSSADQTCFDTMRDAAWWGADALFKHYGGLEFKEMTQKHKIEIPSHFGSQIYFVEQGDCLQWKEGMWHLADVNHIDSLCPIAKVISLHNKGLEIQVWDEKGFYPQVIKLDRRSVPSSAAKNDFKISCIRMRSSSQLSCTVGKRRFILKEGDWLLKVGRSWRNLRRMKDIDDCLQHKIRGELFVFDSIEKQQGKIYLKGHLFDEMRVQITPISLPITSDEKEGGKPKKARVSPLLQKRGKKG